MHTRQPMSEGTESRDVESTVRLGDAARRPYEPPRISRRVPVVRNTLGQPPGGPGSNVSGSESLFGP